MAKYYYTPFQYTDANERRTWNYYSARGALFANCTAPCDVDRMTAQELGEFLVRDGLRNQKVNIRLLVCYGDGPSPIDDDYQPWLATSGGDSTAKKLALDLGTRLKAKYQLGDHDPLHPRVAGYQGPTHTGSNRGTLVKPRGAKSEEKVKAKQPFVWEDSSKPPLEQYIEAYDRASKSFIIWYDAQGRITQKHRPTVALGPTVAMGATGTVGANLAATSTLPTGLTGAAGAAGAAAARGGAAAIGGGPLAAIADGDTLLVMAHGFWKDGGGIGPFAGPFGRKNLSMEVLRGERGQGKADQREIIGRTW